MLDYQIEKDCILKYSIYQWFHMTDVFTEMNQKKLDVIWQFLRLYKKRLKQNYSKKVLKLQQTDISNQLNLCYVNSHVKYCSWLFKRLKYVGILNGLYKSKTYKNYTNDDTICECACCHASFHLKMMFNCKRIKQRILGFMGHVMDCVLDQNKLFVCDYCINAPIAMILKNNPNYEELEDDMLLVQRSLVKHLNPTKNTWLLFWWDFEHTILRFGTITDNKPWPEVTIKIDNSDPFNPGEYGWVNVQNCGKYEFWLCAPSQRKFNDIDDSVLEIDKTENGHQMGWLKASGIFESDCKGLDWNFFLPAFVDGQFRSVYFKQVRHSLKLYTFLCDNQVL